MLRLRCISGYPRREAGDFCWVVFWAKGHIVLFFWSLFLIIEVVVCWLCSITCQLREVRVLAIQRICWLWLVDA